ncbi:MAG: hypothetical protein RL025_1333, partial [Bacteroidota bacterium]
PRRRAAASTSNSASELGRPRTCITAPSTSTIISPNTFAAFRAGSGDALVSNGTLAVQLLEALGDAVQRYTIVEVSGALRERQAQTLAAFGSRVQWVSELPDSINAVVVGNEVTVR